MAEEFECSCEFVREQTGEAVRFLRHQSSITRICESASGVVRTGRLTAGGATRPEFPWLAEDDLPQRISMMPTELVQSAALLVGEVVTFVVSNQIDNRPLG